MWFRKRKKVVFRVRKKPTNDAHYKVYRELARAIVHERLEHWNEVYGFTYQRVAVRNQRRRWGSCSEHGNLNFNYQIILLPETLMDYVIVHELCHLAELNHSKAFWEHVARALPDYKERKQHLMKMTHVPREGFPSSVFQKVRQSAEGGV